MLVLTGCDALFGLTELGPPGDGGIAVDAPALDVPPEIGCADGTREAYLDLVAFPQIAGCNGAWTMPGIATPPSSCGVSGNTSANPTGNGCSIANLCAENWHVCTTPLEVMTRTNGAGCGPISSGMVFYTTQATGNGAGSCNFAGSDDFFGCGTIGLTTTQPDCTPLNRGGYGTGIDASCHLDVGGWDCSGPTTLEAFDVTKRMDDSGGALCCRT